tara:strand:+ start:117 stop:308 length:192 start_codon:yes stop_codon:yes gene_type:complete
MSLDPFGNYNVDLENVYIIYGEWVESEEFLLEEEEKERRKNDAEYFEWYDKQKQEKEAIKKKE